METRTFETRDAAKIEIFYDVYKAEKEVAVLELIHGSVEHIGRYKYFCEYLAERGITVYAMDLRGHGRSLLDNQLGYFSDASNGWELILDDMEQMLDIIKEDTQAKRFILGHSMGSFLAKDFIYSHSNDFEGAIIMGTNDLSKGAAGGAIFLANFVKLFHGKKYRSKMVHGIIYDQLSSKEETNHYLSHDKSIVEKYNADKFCGYTVTLDYAIQMGKGLSKLQAEKKLESDTIRVLFVSGKEDPISGKDNKEVLSAYNNYKTINPKNEITMHLYENMYHEILNEVGKEAVYDDLINFILK